VSGGRKVRQCVLKMLGVAILGAGGLYSLAAMDPAAATEPPQALKDRVQEFYTLLQGGKWTQAEAYFTEDSRETFRNTQKGQMLGFEVKSFTLGEDGQSASVVVNVSSLVPFAPRPLPFPQTTQWRLVKGVWYVELPKAGSGQLQSPFLPGGPVAMPHPPPEQLKFKGHLYRLGNIFPGQTKTARFPFTNVTDHLVTITSVDLGSRYLHLKTEKKAYKPGESGELAIEFDQQDWQGGFGQTILVTTDPGHLVTKLTILGFVAFRQEESPPKSNPPAAPKPN